MKEVDKSELLLQSVRSRDFEQVLNLVKQGANINYKDKFKDNSLFYAVVNQDYRIVSYLIDQGADLNMTFEKNKNLLHISIESNCEEKGNFQITKLLVEKGVDLNYKDKYGNTPLHYACLYYVVNKNTIKLLLDKGADMYSKNNFGHSVFSSAKENERIELLEILSTNEKPSLNKEDF